MKNMITMLLSCLIWTLQAQESTLSEGLVLHADFEGDASDRSANRYNGVLHGATITNDAIVGSHAVYFDGVDNYVAFPENQIYFSGDYAISVWCKTESLALWSRILDFNQDEPMSGNAVTWLIGRPATGTEGNLWLDQWVIHNGIAVESILNQRATPADAYLNYNIAANEWLHLVVVYDSVAENPLGVQKNTKDEDVPLEGVVTLYVNGEKKGVNIHCLKPQPRPTVANWLGRSRFAPDPYYKGWMDDFRIYNRVLTETEIHDLYQLRNK